VRRATREAQLVVTGSDARPLHGSTVVVTRASEQARDLLDRLVASGAEVVAAPTIEILDPVDGGAELVEVLAGPVSYDWLVVTSPNGAERVLDALGHAGGNAHTGGDGHTGSLGAGVRVAAIGPGTAEVLARAGLSVDLQPERYVAESLLEAFGDPPPGGGRVLLARAAVARDVLPDGLRARGWTVDVVDAYRTVGARYDDDTRARVGAADAITFTSSSTVRNFVDAMGGSGPALAHVPPIVVCIGPVTAATAEELGFRVTAVAEEHTIDGLVSSLVDVVARRRR